MLKKKNKKKNAGKTKAIKKKNPKLRKKTRALKSFKKKDMADAFNIKKEKKPDNTFHKTKIRVIGVGGGGGSIVSEIVHKVKKVDFVLANTDIKSLRETPKGARRFQFGEKITYGLGTGMNVELGELSAQSEKDKIQKLLEGQDLCIIVSCLGGGTGSGAVPIFAKISRNLGNLTYGIFTLPFEFEGEKKMEIARQALEKIKPHLNAYSVIPNERIFQIIDKNTPLNNALSMINKWLADNLEGLIEMIYVLGIINIDFADLKTVLEGRGRLTYLNSIEIEGINREELAKKVVSSPLYPYTTKGAKGVLYNVVGDKSLQLSEVSSMSKIIFDSVNKKAKIIFGINQNQKNKDKIKMVILATGCNSKDFFPQSIKEDKNKYKNSFAKNQKIASAEKKKKLKKIQKQKNTIKKEKTEKAEPEKSDKRRSLLKKDIKKNISAIEKKKTKKNIHLENKAKTADLNKNKKANPKQDEIKKEDKKTSESLFPENKKPVVPDSKPREEKEHNIQIRRSGLEIKKVKEEQEKEFWEQESVWETPAIFRKKTNDV